MKGYCSLNMHVDVAASWLYMLYYSVAVYFFFILLSYYYVHRMPKMLLKLPHLP